ncbi:MAG: copper resistance CopC/CopD family protein, partial [Acidimicrobiaceae bacterium]
VLESAPTVWTLTYSKDVPLNSASAEIISASGVRTQLPTPTYGVSNKQVVFTLPADLTGKVTGRWRLVGLDGHVVSARVSFSVVSSTTIPQTDANASATTTTVVDAQAIPDEYVDDSVPEPVRFGVRLFGYVAMLLFGGLLFSEIFLAKGVLRAPRAMETLILSTVVLIGAPLFQALVFLDDSQDVGVVGAFGHLFSLFNSEAGFMMFLRMVAGITLFASAVKIQQSQSNFATPLVIGVSAVYLFALSYAGHSRSMAWPLLGVPTGMVHTASVAVWLGGLAVFVLFVLPVVSAQEGLNAFRRFGDAAQYAVIVMVVSGVIQSLRLHGTFVTLITEGHGRWLLFKVVLVVCMLKIGDINRQRVIKRLPQSEIALEKRLSLLRRASLTEIVNGGIVIAVSTVLATASFT